MARRILFAVLAGMLIMILLLWAPWVTPGFVRLAISVNMQLQWMMVIDGCGVDCPGCGAVWMVRAPLGAYVGMRYRCGLYSPAEPAYFRRVFVSSFGYVFDLPRP